MSVLIVSESDCFDYHYSFAGTWDEVPAGGGGLLDSHARKYWTVHYPLEYSSNRILWSDFPQ